MKLDELQALLDNPAGIEKAEMELLSTLGQRLVRLPQNHEAKKLTECTCGLLLIELPRTVDVERAYVIPAKITCHPAASMQPVCTRCGAEVRLHDNRKPCTIVICRTVTLRYAHAAHPDTGAPACTKCLANPTACTHSVNADVCDTPDPVGCVICADPVSPGDPTCPTCTPGDPEWDKDRHLGC